MEHVVTKNAAFLDTLPELIDANLKTGKIANEKPRQLAAIHYLGAAPTHLPGAATHFAPLHPMDILKETAMARCKQQSFEASRTWP